MATSIQFDLNIAFQNWREKLQQSAHFRTENLDELESHVRDSVSVLQSKGLTADEAFMIGIRRVGTADALEDQFAAENGGRGWRAFLRRFSHKYKNKILHGIILGYFTFGSWLLWGCLKVSQMMEPASARADRLAGVNHMDAPGFTRLFWTLMPYWYVLPVLAAIYCGIVWTRKSSGKSSWIAFFCLTTAILFIFLIPVLIATELPFIAFLNRIPARTFEAPH
jgi:hypothetical protein